MKAFHVDVRRHRAGKALTVGSVVLLGLFAGFFKLQLAQSPVYAVEASGHRARALVVEAPRGVIVDRHGAPLADNVPAYALLLLPVPSDTARMTLTRLAPHLDLSADEVAELTARQRREPRRPLVVSMAIGVDLVDFLDAHPSQFPGVLVEARPARSYPAGAAAGHLVAGVEAAYDRILTGTGGLRFVEVDAVGRLVRPLPHRLTRAPAAGEMVRLNIDLELQREVARLIPDGARAGVVALAPATGAVLALYSSPGFDPADPPDAPAADRALGGVYMAGDLWQVVTAAMALRYGIVDPTATLPLPCRGGMRYGDRYLPCHDRRGHGALDLAEALQRSCNVYFYQLGLKIGLDRLVEEGARMGFGAPTGIDLPGERAAPFPPDQGLWAGAAADAPDELGMRLAAGDAPVTVSLLRMAQFFAALAASDAPPAPRVVGPGPTAADLSAGRDSVLGADTGARLRDALRRSTREAGSGFGRIAGADWGGKATVAGGAEDGPDWFVGIGGMRDGAPEIVVAVVMEDRIAGSDAATVARHAAASYLNRIVVRSGDDGRH